MQKQPVVIKSIKNGICLVLDDTLSFTELLKEIKQKFLESDKFFKNAKIAISFEGRTLSEKQQYEIVSLIEQNSSISIVCIIDHDDLMEEVISRRMHTYEEAAFPTGDSFHNGTLRSGQQLESKGSLIVLGDVNPGAMVKAAGNIVVLGALKGTAYAGATGDEGCFVAALEMKPVQIKIADTIGRAADPSAEARSIKKKAKPQVIEPQIATVYEHQILIEPLKK